MAHSEYVVAYASKRGSAREAAGWIAEELGGADLVDLKANADFDMSKYRTVVLGTGILAGKAYPPMRKFIRRRRTELVQKDVCLFITHLEEGEGIERDFQTAFEPDFLRMVRVRKGVGGRVRLSQLNFLLRKILRSLGEKAGKDFTDYDTLSREACREFARRIGEDRR